MKKFRPLIAILVSCIGFIEVIGQTTTSRLWYRQPANQWLEALPVGNGRMGAMVYGRTDTEHILLNEETIWAGCKVNAINPGARSNLKQIQQLLLDGKNDEAYKLAKQHLLGKPPGIRSYQPLGDLWIEWAAGTVQRYERSLDLSTAIATARYTKDGKDILQEVFVSAPDNVIVVHLETKTGTLPAFNLRLSRTKDARTSAAANVLSMQGQIRDSGNLNRGPEGEHLRFAARALVQNNGGTTIALDTMLRVEGGTSVTILVTGASDYDLASMDFNRSIQPLQECDKILSKAKSFSYSQIKNRHLQEFTPLFNRVKIQLGGERHDELPTDERLIQFKKGQSDEGLTELYFQYGRYLLLCSSRFPGKLPANLQGKWNPHLDAPWQSDYHTNINIQMNYWPADVTNIGETVLPLAKFSSALMKDGQLAAKDIYGARGWMIHHATDIYGRNTIIDDPIWGTSPLAGAWMILNLFDHYAFSGDQQYLKEQVYPLMKQSALFIMDFLIEDRKGYLVTAPSMSPENSFFIDGLSKPQVITYAPTIDVQIIHALFNRLKSVSSVVKEQSDFLKTIDSIQKRLPPVRINQYGGIQEWIEDYKEAEPGHRHISHLFGLHPADELTRDSELMKAASVTLEHRLQNGGGHTGWSRAWIINFYARLKEGNKAYFHFTELLRKSTLSNLFDDHPPFQIDGNFGGTAGIAEMFLQSHNNNIELLPALPAAWKDGSINGLLARGAFEINMKWKGGVLIEAEVLSRKGNSCNLVYGDKKIVFKTEAGKKYKFDHNLKNL